MSCIKIRNIRITQPRFAAKKSLSPGDIYDLACVYALAAASPRLDKTTAEQLVQKALALLTRVEGAGYFGTRQRLEHAKKDDDLKALRERQEFKMLLERAEKRLTSSLDAVQW